MQFISKKQGSLFTISAPSGAGKTSLVKALAELDSKLTVSVSHTTRPPRPSEIDGSNYHFIEESTFKQMVNQGDFLESAKVFDYYYGTSKAWVNSQLKSGFDVALEIDWQGVEQIKKRMPQTCSIFILPPSKASLEERLTKRKQDDPATIARRMAEAVKEMSYFRASDYLVLNKNFDEALDELKVIVNCQRLATANRSIHLQETLSDLLK